MKFNKWTVALAAVGAVSLASVAQAEEKMLLGSQAELTSTTISGYVSTSAAWDFGKKSDQANSRGYSYSGGKGDGFNLDVVDVTLEKALDESEWASGYKAELWFGPDAAGIGSRFSGTGDVAIKQAFVALRTPIGNGIDWKVGVFDTIVGYESSNAGDNPNYTRSWGYSIEPTQHTGILGTYRFCDVVSASFGVANTWDAPINARHPNDSTKTFMGSVALTAPESFGFLHGGSLYAGLISGKPSTGGPTKNHYYVGTTIPTPVEGFKVGFAFDYLEMDDRTLQNGADTTAIAAYLSAAVTEKLTFHSRVDWIKVGGDGLVPAGGAGSTSILGGAFNTGDELLAVTLTADYQLWKNVISRLELRWDHDFNDNNPRDFRSGPSNVAGTAQSDEFTLAANFIYKF